MSNNLFDSTTDFLGVFDGISAQDAEVWARARSFREDCLPVINEHWEKSEYPSN